MRLLNTETLQLENFLGAEDDVPPYCILSHTWGEHELLYEKMHSSPLPSLKGDRVFHKVRESCDQARRDGFEYIWIDTCCIDQRSSAELSEAINSMFKWYQQSSVCYVYLADFEVPKPSSTSPPLPHGVAEIGDDDESFCRSRWFDRGWTLQELIAPREVLFFDRNWVNFGARDGQLFRRICERTRILPQIFLSRHCQCSRKTMSAMRNGICAACDGGDNLPDLLGSLAASVIMSWAATRQTTRKEDVAYSLMGLFEVNMPLLYGEGDKAFMRLQSAIVKQSSDHSILLWRLVEGGGFRSGCLASSPSAFEFPPPIVPQRIYYDFDNETMPRLAVGITQDADVMEISENVLTITVWICQCDVIYSHRRPFRTEQRVMGILNCGSASNYFVRPAIMLSHSGSNLYRRIELDTIFMIDPRPQSDKIAVTSLCGNETAPRTSGLDLDRVSVSSAALKAARREDIRLMISRSGPSFVQPKDITYDKSFTSSDAVCSIVNQLKGRPILVKVLGGYPTIYSADSCPPMLPMVRSLLSYNTWPTLTLIGGVHLFSIEVLHTNLTTVICIIWGLHFDPKVTEQEDLVWDDWRPWCRIFDAAALVRDAEMPMVNDKWNRADAASFQKRLRSWLQKMSGKPDWHVRDPDGQYINVMPDSGELKWAADRMIDLFPKSEVKIGLSTRMSIVEALGRKSNDVELTVLTPECRGWAAKSFDGSKADQKVLQRGAIN